MSASAKLPKAELHVHLEGTVSPEMAVKLAHRNGIDLPEGIFNDEGDYNWHDFPAFLNSYDTASSVIITPQDYEDITYDYLSSIAQDGAVYAELTLGPDIPAMLHDMDYNTYVGAVAKGIERAKADFGIESRIIICMIRHMGPEVAEKLMDTVAANPHTLVVGVGLAGNEMMHQPKDFAVAFNKAQAMGLGCTAHAGEVGGPESVWNTINDLPVTRIGHGVRAIDDAALVKELGKRGISLEVCPNSNIALDVYDDFPDHPLRKLYDAGVVGSLNSDDPPFFWTTLANEYDTAKKHFAFTDAELLGLTKRAVETSFADDKTKAQLLQRIQRWEQVNASKSASPSR